MAIYNFTVAPDEARNFKAKLLDRRTHAIHGGVVLAGIPFVGNEPVDWPQFNSRGGDWIEGTAERIKNSIEEFVRFASYQQFRDSFVNRQEQKLVGGLVSN